MSEASAVSVDKETAKYLLEQGKGIGAETQKYNQTVNLSVLDKNVQTGIGTCIVRVGQEFKEINIQEPRAQYKHELLTIKSMVDYLSGEDLKEEDIRVFVSEENVTAIVGYGKYRTDEVCMNFNMSSEFAALNRIFAGVDQKGLHTLLRGDLAGCFSTALLMQISSLRFSRNFNADQDITSIGVANEKRSDVLEIAWNTLQGTQKSEIGTEWDWTGRIWNNYDVDSVVKCALNIDTMGPAIKFSMIPKRLDQIKRDVLALITEELSEKTPDNVRVYAGSFEA